MGSLGIDLTYLRFHFIFTIPLLALLLFVSGKRGVYTYNRIAIALVLGIVVYVTATPWDSFLIHNNVWAFNSKPVVGTLFGIPYEEYFFFGVQTAITTLFYFNLVSPALIDRVQKQEEKQGYAMFRGVVNKIGLAALVGACGFIYNLHGQKYFYMKSILLYFLPFIGTQVLFGLRQLLNPTVLPRLLLAIGLPTGYLWLADGIAIKENAWSISKATSTGFKLYGVLPVEEAVFFFITNVVIVLGLYLVDLNWDLAFGTYKDARKWAAVAKIAPSRKVTVIGAGVGGLAVAARLAKIGFDVTVYEKKDHVGGRLDYIYQTDKQGRKYRFDVGPSIMLMPEMFEMMYADLGRDIKKYLDLVRCDPIYGIHFDDNDTLLLSNDTNKMKLLLEKIEPGSYPKWLQFLKEGHDHYYTSIEIIVGRNFKNILEYFNPVKLPLLYQMKTFIRFYDYIGQFFKNEKLKQAMSFQNMYLGISPHNAMATYSLLQYTEFCDGVWYPKGGMYRIAETLREICLEYKVKFKMGKEVSKIDVDGKKVKNLEFNDGTAEKDCDIVVCNADLPFVYKRLLPESAENKRIENLAYTSSTIMFYWAVNKRFSKIQHHNIFLCGNYKKSYDQIFEGELGKHLPDAPSFYINAPSRTDSTVCAPEADALMVLVPVGHMNSEDNGDKVKAAKKWEKLKAEAKKWVIQRVSKLVGEDIEQHILSEVSYTPLDWFTNYNLEKGSTFGLSHNFLQVGYLRPHNQHDIYSNLYFSGASTHPGSGVPLVLLSAKLATERIVTTMEM